MRWRHGARADVSLPCALVDGLGGILGNSFIVLAVDSRGSEERSKIGGIGEPGLQTKGRVLSRVRGSVEGEAPVADVLRVDAVGAPVTNFVKQHLGEAVIGVEVIPCGELQPTGPIGRRKHERTATNVQTQTRRCGQPDDLTRIHVPRHDRALVLGIVLVSVFHAHRISLFVSWRTLFTPNPVQPIAPAGTACGVSMGVGGPPSLAAGVTAGSGSVWTARPVCPSRRNWTACAAVHAVARPTMRSRSARGTPL